MSSNDKPPVMVELPDDAIKALVKAASGIDIMPELLARVPEAVEYVNAWRKTLIDNGSLREESPTNEFLGVVTIAATWAVNGVIAARARAEAVAAERQRIAQFLRGGGAGLLAHWMAADQYDIGNASAYTREAGIRAERLIAWLAAGSVPVATPGSTEWAHVVAMPGQLTDKTLLEVLGLTDAEQAEVRGRLRAELDAIDQAGCPRAEQPTTCEHGRTVAHYHGDDGDPGNYRYCDLGADFRPAEIPEIVAWAVRAGDGYVYVPGDTAISAGTRAQAEKVVARCQGRGGEWSVVPLVVGSGDQTHDG